MSFVQILVPKPVTLSSAFQGCWGHLAGKVKGKANTEAVDFGG